MNTATTTQNTNKDSEMKFEFPDNGISFMGIKPTGGNAMSIDRCFRCNAMVDTDDDPECYADVSACVCENCRDEFKTFSCDKCGQEKPITEEVTMAQSLCLACREPH